MSPLLLSLLPVLLLLPASLLPAQKEADAIVEPSTKVPRGKLLEWKSTEGKTYWYRLPKDIDAKNPPDLLLMLHGTGLDKGWSFWNYPILGDFRKRDIVVSPDAMTPGQGDTFNFVQGPKDGDQIAGIIVDFKKRFPIGRVYLYGHSQGAFFTYWFAGEHPELIDGIVAHAGNVLDVKHNKLTKQKVAIGILHGRADAVVPVDCAIRTEKIYREQGYEKLKLEIVDGLTKASGHWPLPMQVAKMLEWLDQVSTQSARQAVAVITNELQQKQVDVATIAEQWQKAKTLLPKSSDADKQELAPQLDAIEGLLGKAMEVHMQHLLADGQVLDAKAAFGAWVLHFQLVDRAFDDRAEWKKAMQKVRELASRHGKLVDKAQKALEKASKDSRATACKAYATAFLASDVESLRPLIEGSFRDVKPADPEAEQQFLAVVETRKQAAAEAQKAVDALMAPLVEELRQSTPALFAAVAEGEADK